jgi:hypothetical protein
MKQLIRFIDENGHVVDFIRLRKPYKTAAGLAKALEKRREEIESTGYAALYRDEMNAIRVMAYNTEYEAAPENLAFTLYRTGEKYIERPEA